MDCYSGCLFYDLVRTHLNLGLRRCGPRSLLLYFIFTFLFPTFSICAVMPLSENSVSLRQAWNELQNVSVGNGHSQIAPVVRASTASSTNGTSMGKPQQGTRPASINTKRGNDRTNKTDANNFDSANNKGPVSNKANSNNTRISGSSGNKDEQSFGENNSGSISTPSFYGFRPFEGGFIEFIEWLFVFILVAPGTFPAIGCMIFACGNFWRRRFPPSSAAQDIATLVYPPLQESSQTSAYQRVPSLDSSVRERNKSADEEKDKGGH